MLFVLGDVKSESQTAFNDWYNQEQIPRLLAIPGILNAARYRALDDHSPVFNHAYDLSDVDVVERPDYLAIRAGDAGAQTIGGVMNAKLVNQIRGVYRHLLTIQRAPRFNPERARWELVVGLEIDPVIEEEFTEWYDTEHLPALAGLAGVARARRFVLHCEASRIYGGPPSYLALYDLEDPGLPEGEEWQALIQSAWSRRIARFRRIVLRKTFVRIFSA